MDIIFYNKFILILLADAFTFEIWHFHLVFDLTDSS